MEVFCLLIFIYFAPAAVHGKVGVQGDPVELDCYDPAEAKRYDDYFVDVKFRPSDRPSQDLTIAKYKASTRAKKVMDAQFQNRLDFTATGAVVISDIGLNDEGQYTCESNSFQVDGRQVSSDLAVYVKPVVSVRKITDPMRADSGLAQAALCEAVDGKPAASVAWSTDRHLELKEVKENSSSGPVLVTTSSALHIEAKKFYDKQSFQCTVVHPAFAQPIQRAIVLNVTYPPEEPTIQVNNDLRHLTCTSHGNPPALVVWTLPAGVDVTTPTVEIADADDPRRSNDTYTCTASNGVGPAKRVSITTGEAVTVVPYVHQSNVGLIVGCVVGGIAVLAVIVAAVYCLLLKPAREKDTGPYKTSLAQLQRDESDRPIIHHANPVLNKRRPPSPDRPPPHDEKLLMRDDDDGEFDDVSDDDDDGDDVDVDVNAATTVVDPAKWEDGDADRGITSRASINFQARRQRPSTSPGIRNSMRNSVRNSRHSPVPQPRPSSRTMALTPRYDLPPGGAADDRDAGPLRYHDTPHGYGDGHHDPPQYGGYPHSGQTPRSEGEHLPPYEPHYTELDHSAYKHGGSSRRVAMEEPVEYAQIRQGYSHVV